MVDKVIVTDILDQRTTGQGGANLVNDLKRAVNQLVEAVNSLEDAPYGSAAERDVGTALNEVPLNSDLGTASTKDVGTGGNQVPTNDNLGSAAYVDTGTAAGEVPLNSDLGTASTRDVGDGDADVVTNFKLNSRVRTYDPSSPRLSTRAIPTGSSNWGTSRMTPDGTKVWLTSGQLEATQHSLSTPFDMTTVSSEEASLSLPNSTKHILWNADGTMAYFVSNGAEEVYEVSLSTAYDLSTAGAVTTRSISSWSTTYNPVDWNTSYFGPTGDELFILTYNTNNGQSAFSSHALSTPYRVDTVGTGLESIVIDVNTSIRGFAAMSEDGEYVITFSTHMVVTDRHLNSYVVYKLTTPYSLDSAVAVQRGKLDLPMTTALQFISHVQLLDEGKKLVLNYKYSGEVVNSIVVINLTTVSFE